MRSRALADPAGDVRRDPVGLLRARHEGLVANGRRVVAAPLRVQPLHDPRPGLQPVRVVVADEPVGGLEDRRPRPVVLPQHDDPGLAVALAELEDVADRGAAELVDRLVVVAHHGHVAVPLGDQGDQLGLGPVGVLELVHEHVLEPPLDGLASGRRLAQQPQRQRHLVAEVDRAVRRQERLVAGIRAGELRLTPGVLGQGGHGVAIRLRGRRPRRLDGPRLLRDLRGQPAGVGEVRLGRDVLVLGAREQRREGVEEPRRVAERAVLVELELEHALAQEDHRLRPGQDADVGWQPQLQRELAHQAVPERVERRDGGVRVPVGHQLVDPQLHLVRGLVRERQRQDLRRLRASRRDQPRDPARDHLRLAGARPRHDQQRAVAVRDRAALLGVEPGEQRVDPVGFLVGGNLDRRLLAPDGDLDEGRRLAACRAPAHPQQLVERVVGAAGGGAIREPGRRRGRSVGGHAATMPRARASSGVTAPALLRRPSRVPCPRPGPAGGPRSPPARGRPRLGPR